jgi:hypothetical protein
MTGEVILMAVFVVAVSGFFLYMVLGNGTVTYYDCDLCGRKKICRVREVGKASTGHLCSDCYRSEQEALKRCNSFK